LKGNKWFGDRIIYFLLPLSLKLGCHRHSIFQLEINKRLCPACSSSKKKILNGKKQRPVEEQGAVDIKLSL
jgi:Zn finger protein HypA/HybF involved in hydrogenase expression